MNDFELNQVSGASPCSPDDRNEAFGMRNVSDSEVLNNQSSEDNSFNSELIVADGVDEAEDSSQTFLPAVSEVYGGVQVILSEDSNQADYASSEHDPLDGTGGEAYKIQWNSPMVKALIEEYKKFIHEFKDPMQRQKDLWMKVAEGLLAQGHAVSWDMCDRKWRNLKHTFKTIYYNNKRSPKSKRRWEFYSMLVDIFTSTCSVNTRKSRVISPPPSPSSVADVDMVTTLTESPQILVEPMTVTPVTMTSLGSVESTISLSAIQVPQQMMTYPEVILCDAGPESNNIPEISENTQSTECSRKSDTEPPQWFQNFLMEYRRDEERKMAMLKEMHNEVIQVEKRKCIVLESLLQKLSSTS